MNWKKVTVYFIAPFTVTITMVMMYFSGVDWLQNIVAPRIRGINPTSSREFGLLENLQNGILLAMIVVCVMGALKRRARLERAGLWFVTLFAVFVFLEEIDYGLHYYEYLNDIPWSESREVRNWHNQGDRTDTMKQTVDIAMVLWFGIAPFALMRRKSPLIRYVTPDKYSALTLIAAFLVRSVAHGLQERGVGDRGVIHYNLSEFRETITYWIFFLYLIELSIRRRLFPAREDDAPRGTADVQPE